MRGGGGEKGCEREGNSVLICNTTVMNEYSSCQPAGKTTVTTTMIMTGVS